MATPAKSRVSEASPASRASAEILREELVSVPSMATPAKSPVSEASPSSPSYFEPVPKRAPRRVAKAKAGELSYLSDSEAEAIGEAVDCVPIVRPNAGPILATCINTMPAVSTTSSSRSSKWSETSS